MKEILKLGALLMVVCAVAAAALAGIYSVTKPKIELQKQLELQEALSAAIPGAAPDAVFPVEKDGKILYCEGYRSADKRELVGYALIGQWPGYSSDVKTLVGVDTSGTIIGIKVLEQKETPGLGTRIEEIKYGEADAWFQRQFLGKAAETVAVDKDGGEIQSITGATITSRAVTKSIVSAFNELKRAKSAE
ncbi:MAG: RnfABCDGE type electron transport complex subunit G [candidate division KSB1 bacterium]|nr:RnfABCDGE type electron transport complex subunit G [candidate division KSB1 bacterium]